MERLLGINLYVASAVILIITGTIVCVIALLGSLGAYKEVKCMLKTYFMILLALSAIISTIGALGFVFRSELDDRLQRELQNSMKLYGNDSRITEAWDSLQSNVSATTDDLTRSICWIISNLICLYPFSSNVAELQFEVSKVLNLGVKNRQAITRPQMGRQCQKAAVEVEKMIKYDEPVKEGSRERKTHTSTVAMIR